MIAHLPPIISNHPAVTGFGRLFETFWHAFAYLIGVGVIATAIAHGASGKSSAEILAWFLHENGISFTVLFLVLLQIALMGWVRVEELPPGSRAYHLWLDAGLNAAAALGVVSLAYKLVGIGLGINSLAEHPLNADNVQTIMMELTRNFSMAFMTTVFGLVTSSCLRILLVMAHSRRTREKETEPASKPSAVEDADDEPALQS